MNFASPPPNLTEALLQSDPEGFPRSAEAVHVPRPPDGFQNGSLGPPK